MEKKSPIYLYYALISKPDASTNDRVHRCYGMFVSCYWITEKQKQLPYFRANFVWATTQGVLRTTANPDSDLQAGLWIPIFWTDSLGPWLARSQTTRTVETDSQPDPLAPKRPSPFPPDHTLNPCSILSFGTSLCAKLNKVFFLIKITHPSYTLTTSQGRNESVTSVSCYYRT